MSKREPVSGEVLRVEVVNQIIEGRDPERLKTTLYSLRRRATQMREKVPDWPALAETFERDADRVNDTLLSVETEGGKGFGMV